MPKHGFGRRRRERRLGRAGSRNFTIVVCYDGERTEADYFIGWRRVLGNVGIVIKPYLIASGGNALHAVQASARIKKGDTEHDEFWCVCDVDDTPKGDLQEAKILAARSGISLGISTRSFEVWLALHWGKISTREITCRKEAIELVAAYHPSFGQRAKSIAFPVLLPRTDGALANAIWLEGRGLLNPATTVHALVAKLRDRLRAVGDG